MTRLKPPKGRFGKKTLGIYLYIINDEALKDVRGCLGLVGLPLVQYQVMRKTPVLSPKFPRLLGTLHTLKYCTGDTRVWGHLGCVSW